MTATLFDPIRLGAIKAPNRILMAPLTRGRLLYAVFALIEQRVCGWASRTEFAARLRTPPAGSAQPFPRADQLSRLAGRS